MTYTLTLDPNTVIRDQDRAFIPFDPDNIDYQQYLNWLAEGNEPNPPARSDAKPKRGVSRGRHSNR